MMRFSLPSEYYITNKVTIFLKSKKFLNNLGQLLKRSCKLMVMPVWVYLHYLEQT